MVLFMMIISITPLLNHLFRILIYSIHIMRSSEFFYSHYDELMVLFVMIILIIPFFFINIYSEQ